MSDRMFIVRAIVMSLIAAATLLRPEVGAAQAAPPVAEERTAVADAIQRQLSAGSPFADIDLEHGLLAAFYGERGYRPLWVVGGKLRPEARRVAQIVADARSEGLQPADYHADRLASLLDGARDPAGLATTELLLSQAFARYATDLRYGRTNPEISYTEAELAPERLDPAAMLRRAAAAPQLATFLDGLGEHNFIYERLRDALARERAQPGGEAPPPIPSGELIRRGDRDGRVVQLRQRLGVDAGPEPRLYDEAVEQAVEEFQGRQGLAADGVVGPDTLAALNRTAEDRVRTIVANMERARWLPLDFGERFLLVDVAGFELGMFEQGQEVGRMKVVVGKEQQRTPMFADKMEYVVINPYWNIPQSIVRNEIAPAVRRQGVAYLKRRNMEVLRGWGGKVISPSSVSWSAAARGDVDFRVRQRPGPGNALGRIKFMFPNRFSIYLHDTPAGHLFDRSRRAFSHGCVRVARPLDLAAFVFRTTEGWDDDRVRQAIDSGGQQVVRLDRQLPVYVTYFTAWPRQDGSVAFRSDLYGRDADLKSQLFNGR